MTRSNDTTLFLANLQQNLRVHTVAARLSSPISHQWTVDLNDLVDVDRRSRRLDRIQR
jgi:hypothetical protein